MIKWVMLGYVFLEVLVTIQVGGDIGGLNTFLEIVISAFLGFVVLFNFKNSFAQSMMELMHAKIDIKVLVAHNLLSFLGALLLILPGFVSDALGILLQIRFVTGALGALYRGPERRTHQSRFRGDDRRIHEDRRFHSEFVSQIKKGDEDVIDVEIIDSDSTK